MRQVLVRDEWPPFVFSHLNILVESVKGTWHLVNALFFEQNCNMQPMKPFAVLLILGLSFLYYGIDLFVQGSSIAALIFGVVGIVLAYLALSRMGDQRADHSRYRSRPKNPVHIPSIPDGEYTGENHGTTIMNEQAAVEIRELVQNGRIMDAIRVYRQVTGHGLVDSKEYINAVIRELEEEARNK